MWKEWMEIDSTNEWNVYLSVENEREEDQEQRRTWEYGNKSKEFGREIMER